MGSKEDHGPTLRRHVHPQPLLEWQSAPDAFVAPILPVNRAPTAFGDIKPFAARTLGLARAR